MEVFEARVRCYANELAHLDATRGMIGCDLVWMLLLSILQHGRTHGTCSTVSSAVVFHTHPFRIFATAAYIVRDIDRVLPAAVAVAPSIRWDFGKFFVVKESLALMYKELQLPSEALLKYQVGHETPCLTAYGMTQQ